LLGRQLETAFTLTECLIRRHELYAKGLKYLGKLVAMITRVVNW